MFTPTREAHLERMLYNRKRYVFREALTPATFIGIVTDCGIISQVDNVARQTQLGVRRVFCVRLQDSQEDYSFS